MVLFERLVDAPDFGERTGIEQMAVGRLEIRPALLQIVERRQRIGRALGGDWACALPSAYCGSSPMGKVRMWS